MNIEGSNATPKLPWISADDGLDSAVFRIISELEKSKSAQRTGKELPPKAEAFLRREYKAAKHGRSDAGKFMRALADSTGVEDPSGAFIIADMKAWSRTKEKFAEAARNTNDMGRGRMYLENTEEYHAFLRVLRSKTKTGILRNVQSHKVRIIEGTITNYLKGARKSGYAGSINFDMEMDIGKGRTGKFEVQVMPRAYERVDKISHKLFDMIRILQEVKESYLGDDDKRVLESLILANQSLFMEHGIRTGFIDIREDKLPKVTDEKLMEATGVLDRIWTSLGEMSGRKYAWIKEAQEAMTEAKTSLMNMNIARRTPMAKRAVVIG